MTVRDNITRGVYDVRRGDFRNSGQYNAATVRVKKQFEADLATQFSLTMHPNREKVFEFAWFHADDEAGANTTVRKEQRKWWAVQDIYQRLAQMLEPAEIKGRVQRTRQPLPKNQRREIRERTPPDQNAPTIDDLRIAESFLKDVVDDEWPGVEDSLRRVGGFLRQEIKRRKDRAVIVPKVQARKKKMVRGPL